MGKPPNNFKMVVGLGNPGSRYQDTYHNVGTLAVQFLASQCCATHNTRYMWRRPLLKPFSFLRCGNFVWVQSLTFMNESGGAVKKAARFFNTTPENIIVLHDESDLSLGAFKISEGRGAAGHHGVESIAHALGTNTFTRVRIGIRKSPDTKAGQMVLAKIAKSEKELFQSVFGEISRKLIEKE